MSIYETDFPFLLSLTGWFSQLGLISFVSLLKGQYCLMMSNVCVCIVRNETKKKEKKVSFRFIRVFFSLMTGFNSRLRLFLDGSLAVIINFGVFRCSLKLKNFVLVKSRDRFIDFLIPRRSLDL